MAKRVITDTSTKKKIPALEGKGFWGCLPELIANPLGLIKKATAEHQGIVEISIPFYEASLILDPDIAHQILVKEIKRFKKAERETRIMGSILGNGLVTNNDFDSHKVQRKLAQPGFHFRRLESYAETMINYTDQYCRDLPQSDTRNIADDMFQLTMFIVSKTLFDTDMQNMKAEASEIGQAIHDAQEAVNKRFFQVFVLPDWVPTPNNLRIRKARRQLIHTIDNMIHPRALSNGEYEDRGDLLSMLLLAKYEDGTSMPKRQIMDELITLFSAGHETTSNALTWTLHLLSKHPKIQHKLQQELDTVFEGDTPGFGDLDKLVYTEMVFKEAMRIYPPVWMLSTRQATEDVTINHYRIPKGKTIYVAPYAGHYNPRIFPDPERFDPERFRPENEKQLPRHAFLPFGAGGRVCIGNSFAMMEGKLILATLIKRFTVTPVDDQLIAPQPQITLSNKGGVRLQVHTRTTSLTQPSPERNELHNQQNTREALPET